LAVNLSLSFRSEYTGHRGHLELGREGKSRELGCLGIFQAKRLEANKVFAAVGSDRCIRGELDGLGCGHIDTGNNELKRCLLLGISYINGNLCRTKVFQ